MSFLKKGAKIHLKNERKIIRPKPPKIHSEARHVDRKPNPKRTPIAIEVKKE
jgi:hypothetical protein